VSAPPIPPARGTRFLLGFTVASAVAAGAVFWIAGTLALGASGGLHPVGVTLLALGVSALVAWLASAMLARLVARPVERILGAAARLSGAAPGELPLLGLQDGLGGLGLDRAALAFERLAVALVEERARLAAKVEELTAANRALAETRASLLRSEKLATVGRLAAGLAHEVGNPLGAIAGYAEVARARLPHGADPDLRDAVDRIAAAASRIDRTVRELLDFARPAPLDLRPVRIAVALDAALRLARVQTRFRGVALEVAVPEDLPAVVGDEQHLAQVFLNLFLNAGDAMRGQGRVHVSARVAPDGEVVVEVSDTGPGIAPEDLPRIFDPFFTTKDPGAGTGLGLAICHRIAESFGGSIEAENAPSGGARFRLRLKGASR
jgi:two-component system NtrC family sensor kinase